MAPPTTIAKSEPPFTNDKESITADPVDECWVNVTWTRFNSFAADSVLLSQTSDCGATWSEPKAVHVSSPAGFAAQLIVLPDGTLLDFFKELSGRA